MKWKPWEQGYEVWGVMIPSCKKVSAWLVLKVGADGEGDVHLGVVCPEVMEGGFEGFDAFLLAHAVLTKVA